MSDAARREQMKARLGEFRDQTAGLSAAEILRWAAATFGERFTVASSLGAEDQVLAHMISAYELADSGLHARHGPDVQRILRAHVRHRERARRQDTTVFPGCIAGRADDRRAMGSNLFYRSVELRKRCCHVRKVEPLRRALAGQARVDHRSATRTIGDALTARSRSNGTSRTNSYKISPLADWSEEDVWAYIHENGVPYNALHDRGFPSIGCAPCTRAVAPGDDPRSGRWWWERPEHRECGLHVREEAARPADAKVRVSAVRLD